MNSDKAKKIIPVIILISAIVIISLILLIVTRHKKAEEIVAKIYYENSVIYEVDLSKEDDVRTIEVELKEGLVIKIEVKKDAIRVIDAPCKRKDCMKMNWTSSPNKPIVCLDLHYMIILSGKSDYDVVIE